VSVSEGGGQLPGTCDFREWGFIRPYQDKGNRGIPNPSKRETQKLPWFDEILPTFALNFSHPAVPLHKLLKKDAVYEWTVMNEQAFQTLKGEKITP